MKAQLFILALLAMLLATPAFAQPFLKRKGPPLFPGHGPHIPSFPKFGFPVPLPGNSPQSQPQPGAGDNNGETIDSCFQNISLQTVADCMLQLHNSNALTAECCSDLGQVLAACQNAPFTSSLQQLQAQYCS